MMWLPSYDNLPVKSSFKFLTRTQLRRGPRSAFEKAALGVEAFPDVRGVACELQMGDGPADKNGGPRMQLCLKNSLQKASLHRYW